MGEAAIGEAVVCGICFSDGGLAVRGQIDSCDHYFCFICIMEWAKVESRCPLCKQRFRFIRRPEVSDLLIDESVLEIPVRDQVYHPLGNESSALSDPYAQVNCRVCNCSNDDELLLLCDLCDSAFHTYCTGLGYTVPEGDWFCHDCTILREEHEKIDGDADGKDQDQGSPSVFDIVSDESSYVIEQQHFHDRPVSRSTNLRRNSEGIMFHVEAPDSSNSPSQGTDTYLQRRGVGQRANIFEHSCNTQSRIQALRRNWPALQSGSLAFSSTLDNNGDTVSGAKRRTSRPNSVLSQQSESSSLVNSEQVTDSSRSRKTPSISDLQDIDKAWKMMKLAKKQRLPMPNSSLNSLKFNNSLNSVGALPASKYKMAEDIMAGCSTSGTCKQLTTKSHETTCSSFSCATCEAAGRSSAKGYEISDNRAKIVIQSMVKLNLQRLISKGEWLGNEKFKEIARASTHSILAACGLEHSKSCARPFSNQICRHTSRILQPHGSTLMPGSCRKCFCSFVEYVVKSILSEKPPSRSR